MSGPTAVQKREAERNGVLLWKEVQDIEHIKEAVPDGRKCHLCEAVGFGDLGEQTGNRILQNGSS